MSDKTTIWISKDTKARLTKLGSKGETYDQLVCRLLDNERPSCIARIKATLLGRASKGAK